MAFRYIDYNGITVGFGTFNRFLNLPNNPFQFNVSNDGQGTTNTDANGSFSHTYAFGSLFTGANTATGTLTMNGTWDFAANGFYLQGTFTNAAVDQVINRTTGTGSMTLGGTNPFIEVSTTDRKLRFLDWPLKGGVNWEKRGVGTLELGAANEFSAGMTISAGTLQIGNASALGTGTVTMTGGKLSSSSTTGYTVANALTLNGTMTLGDATNTGALTVNGVTNIAGNSALTVASSVTLAGQMTGSGTLTKSGAGNLNLTGSGNNNTGIFTNSAGVTALAAEGTGTPNQLAFVSSLALTGGFFNVFGSGSYTWDRTITGSAGGFTCGHPNLTISGNLSGFTGAFGTYSTDTIGTSIVATFSASNSFPRSSQNFYAGNFVSPVTHTFKYTGTDADVSTSSGYTFNPAGTQNLTVVLWNASANGKALTFSGAMTHQRNTNAVTLQLTTDAAAGLLTLSGILSQSATGVLSISKTGSGSVTLSGANTFTGAVTVSAGTLNANSTTALGSTSGGAITVTSLATLSLGAAPTYSSRSLTISGTGSSSAPNNGALIIANAGTSVFQSITLGSPTNYIRATNSGQINAPFTSNNNSVVFGASAGSDFMPFLSGFNVFSGTGSVTYGGHSLDTGIVQADVRHTYTGNTTLAYGTTSVASSAELPGTGGPLGNKSLTAANTLLMTGGTLRYLGGNVDYSGRFATTGSQQWRIDVNGQTVTYATALVGASSLSLSDNSTGGSLTLSSASSTFSGGVTITSGTLFAGATQSGVSGPLGITGTITFSPAGTGVLGYTSASASFDYSSRFATTAGQTRRVNANGESVTFSTAMGGANAFALVGSAGTLTLAVANTYSQGTTLSVGTLKCGNAASLGTGGLAQANNTTLHVTATGGRLTIQGAHTNTGTGTRIIRIGAA